MRAVSLQLSANSHKKGHLQKRPFAARDKAFEAQGKQAGANANVSLFTLNFARLFSCTGQSPLN